MVEGTKKPFEVSSKVTVMFGLDGQLDGYQFPNNCLVSLNIWKWKAKRTATGKQTQIQTTLTPCELANGKT